MAGPWEKYQDEEAPWAKQRQAAPKTRGQAAQEMVTDIPKEIKAEIDSALAGARSFGDWAKGEGQDQPGLDLESAKKLGRGALKAGEGLAGAGYMLSGMPFVTGAVKSVVGHGGEAVFGPENVDYEQAKEGMDYATMGAGAAGMLKTGARKLLGTTGKMEIPHEPAGSQGPREAERIARGFDPGGQMLAESPEQAAGRMSEGIRKAAEYERQSIAGDFKLATTPGAPGQKPGAINAPAFMVLPQNIVKDLDSARIQLVGNETKQATAMMKDITREVARLSTTNRGGPAAGKVTNVNLSAIDKMKQRLQTYRQAAFESRSDRDIQATQAVMEAFDNHIDQMINSKAFTGDMSKVKAWNIARDRETLYRKTFESDGRRSVSEVVSKIIGDDKHAPATAEQAADFFYGTIGMNPNKFNVAVATRIKGILGPQSVEWATAKQGLFQKVINVGKTDDWQPRLIKDRVLQFLDGDGKEMANFMYSPQERSTMRKFANIQGSLEVAGATGVTTQQPALKLAGKMAGILMNQFSTTAHAMHAGATFAEGFKMGSQAMRDLQSNMSKIESEVQKWKAAVERAKKYNADVPRQQRLQEYQATVALSLALRKLGISDIGPAQSNQEQKKDKLAVMGGPAM